MAAKSSIGGVMVPQHDVLPSAESTEPTGAGTPADALGVTKRMLQLPLGAYQTAVSECPVCESPLTSSKALGPHVYHNHPDIHTVTERIRADFDADPADVLRTLHQGAGLTVQQISQRFGYHRDAVAEAFDMLGVERDRRAGLQQLWEDRPDEGREHATKNAGLGAAGREQNGMAGVTGQDHPHWRGGKSIYDAVKKQLPGPSWDVLRNRTREEAGGECETCGRSAEEIEHRDLDVHHVVPILCGGTNDAWNRLALCPSCHHKAEWFTRQYPEFEAVLLE